MKKLELDGNPDITDKGFSSIVDALKDNFSLQTLAVSNITILAYDLFD